MPRCPGVAVRPTTRRPPKPAIVTAPGVDVESFAWAPDGGRLAIMARLLSADPETSQIGLVDLATGQTEVIAGEGSLDTGARWLADGSLLYVSDADGWFQVVRRTADGHDRIVLTAGEREHGEPSGGIGFTPLPSPDGRRFVHGETRDGLLDLIVGDLAAAAPKRGRGRPPKTPRTVAAAAAGRRINPWDGVWRSVGWPSDGAWVAAIGESETQPQDLWLLPVPGARPPPTPDLAVSPTRGRPSWPRPPGPVVWRPVSGSPSMPATGCGWKARSGAR